MSQANVETVKRSIDAHNRRDIDAYAELITPDYELLPAMTGFAGVSFRGREGLERYFRELRGTWEEFRVIGEQYRDLGEDVFVVMRLEARGRGSGVPVAARQALICEFRDGKISRIRSYLDPAEALRAVGLPEQAISANLELVRSIYAAWEREDYSITEWADPEIEFEIADGPSPSSQRGLEAMAKAWLDVLSVWRDYRAVAEGYRDLDDGRVLVLTAFRARGRASHIQVSQVLARGVSLMHVRDGKVTRLVLYFNRDRGLADLGIAPEAD